MERIKEWVKDFDKMSRKPYLLYKNKSRLKRASGGILTMICVALSIALSIYMLCDYFFTKRHGSINKITVLTADIKDMDKRITSHFDLSFTLTDKYGNIIKNTGQMMRLEYTSSQNSTTEGTTFMISQIDIEKCDDDNNFYCFKNNIPSDKLTLTISSPSTHVSVQRKDFDNLFLVVRYYESYLNPSTLDETVIRRVKAVQVKNSISITNTLRHTIYKRDKGILITDNVYMQAQAPQQVQSIESNKLSNDDNFDISWEFLDTSSLVEITQQKIQHLLSGVFCPIQIGIYLVASVLAKTQKRDYYTELLDFLAANTKKNEVLDKKSLADPKKSLNTDRLHNEISLNKLQRDMSFKSGSSINDSRVNLHQSINRDNDVTNPIPTIVRVTNLTVSNQKEDTTLPQKLSLHDPPQIVPISHNLKNEAMPIKKTDDKSNRLCGLLICRRKKRSSGYHKMFQQLLQKLSIENILLKIAELENFMDSTSTLYNQYLVKKESLVNSQLNQSFMIDSNINQSIVINS